MGDPQPLNPNITGREDADFDGVPDIEDAFPTDPNEFNDLDGDGIGNNADTDDDGNGIPDNQEDALAIIPRTATAPTIDGVFSCLLYTSPSPRDATLSRMPSSA